jgi:hypothetical protein
MIRLPGSQSSSFDLEAPGSRFTTHPAFAVRVGHEWMDRSEREAGVARRAIVAELGDSWIADDPDIGEATVLDGVQGRGAAAWIPIVEWIGLHAAGGVVGFGAGQAAREGIKRIWTKIKDARSCGHRVMISRGCAAFLAMEHVFETTDGEEVLQVEFAHEPSSLAGRPVTETSYVGIEPWIISLLDEPRKTRYVLAVSPEGDIEGCIATPVGVLEAAYSPVLSPE